MNNIWQHFLAFFRGSVNDILGDFDKIKTKLDTHAAYTAAVASCTYQQAHVLRTAAAKAQEESDKALVARNNIAKLMGEV